MAQQNSAIHLFAGGMGGTVGAIATCPLEVVKTRLQSSSANFRVVTLNQQPSAFTGVGALQSQKQMGLISCIKNIVEVEGVRALWKGLVPNLVGVAPSRAIYFYAYHNSKSFLTGQMSIPESSYVHMASAFCAGFTACSLTNPIWLIKTRVQLDRSRSATGSKFTVLQCIKLVYKESGLKGFYKGITASYYGISETVVHFVIYEALKKIILNRNQEREGRNPDEKRLKDYFMFMVAAACSKTSASTICYPHEVARTRLREPGRKYRHFWQTLHTVFTEEGIRGIYRGLGTQLLRQIPNTAFMMATYEGIVYLLGGKTEASEMRKKYHKLQPAENDTRKVQYSQDTSHREPYSVSSNINSRCAVTVSVPGAKPLHQTYSTLALSATAGTTNGIITVSTDTVHTNKQKAINKVDDESDLENATCEHEEEDF